MRLARLGFLVGCVLFAGGASAQSPPPGDEVDPWVSTPPPGPPPKQVNDADAWRGDADPAPPARGTKVLKKAPVKVVRQKQPVRVAVGTKKGAAVPDGPIAWFPGFLRLQNGSTRVFLEVSKRVEVTEHRAEGRVVFRLKGVNVPDKTNRLPLLTGWIATPVDRVQLAEAGPDADLVIELREKVEFVQRIVDTPRGMALQVDFPPSAKLAREAEQGENGMPVAPVRARLKTTSTRIDSNDSSF